MSETAAAGKTHVFATILKMSGRVISFYNGGQFGWQEYSELSNSALLALSASAIGRNRQLGIFRNSEYLPFSPNPLFTGREAELEALCRGFQEGGVIAVTQAVAVHGLGGGQNAACGPIRLETLAGV